MTRINTKLNEFKENWKEYLHCLERVWNKSASQYGRHPSWNGWAGRFRTSRSQDPLLAYLKNARDVDQHTIQAISQRTAGGVGIKPAQGNSLYIKEMMIQEGKMWIRSPQKLKIVFIPAKTKLLPIENRRVKYSVPTSHLGMPVDSENVIEIAEKGYLFYASFLNEADASFKKENPPQAPDR
jgi:hypothetical protein